ncbi:MAG: phosphate ABC transporter permease subunit PstC [Acidobacteria bacterium]|nr:phosphate ABC transporter permease subunit PstC [Acidobacteriota bacterium]
MSTGQPASHLVADPSPAFQARNGEITQAPTRVQIAVDRAFRRTCFLFACLTILLVTFIVLRIALSAIPAIQHYGIGYLSGRVWDPNAERYGILAEIWGTLYTSVLALLLGTAFGVAAAIFLSEEYLGHAVFGFLRRMELHLHPIWGKLPEQLEALLRNLIELLAAIPSVVYGLWGLFVLIPLIRPVCHWVHLKLGWISFFSSDLSGPGVLPAVIVLAIMIMPTIAAISRDALVSVPPKLRMAAYGLGATRWEALLAVIIPTAARGIFGGVILALGRALGETMALAMLVGNANKIQLSLFSPANTLAALLANNFPEAGAKEVSVLMYAALVLLGITLAVNILGSVIIQRASLAPVE